MQLTRFSNGSGPVTVQQNDASGLSDSPKWPIDECDILFMIDGQIDNLTEDNEAWLNGEGTDMRARRIKSLNTKENQGKSTKHCSTACYTCLTIALLIVTVTGAGLWGYCNDSTRKGCNDSMRLAGQILFGTALGSCLLTSCFGMRHYYKLRLNRS